MIIPSIKEDKLPDDFLETVVSLENNILETKDFEKVDLLTNMYQIGIEFFSRSNSQMMDEFICRLKYLWNWSLENKPSSNNRTRVRSRTTKIRSRFNIKQESMVKTMLKLTEKEFASSCRKAEECLSLQIEMLKELIKRKRLRKLRRNRKSEIKFNFLGVETDNRGKRERRKTTIDESVETKTRLKRSNTVKPKTSQLDKHFKAFVTDFKNTFKKKLLNKLMKLSVDNCEKFYKKSKFLIEECQSGIDDIMEMCDDVQSDIITSD